MLHDHELLPAFEAHGIFPYNVMLHVSGMNYSAHGVLIKMYRTVQISTGSLALWFYWPCLCVPSV